MRTVDDDLTGPARIRNAAVTLFARDGFDAGVRAIAEEAGVSLGLVRHHFGSKEGLRAACDDHVLERLEALQSEQVTAAEQGGLLLDRLFEVDEHAPVVLYVVRALREGGPLAATLVDRMIADATVYLSGLVAAGEALPSVDPAARARHLTLTGLGGLLLEFALAPADVPPAEVWRRYSAASTLPALELYAHGLLVDRTALDTYLAADARRTKES